MTGHHRFEIGHEGEPRCAEAERARTVEDVRELGRRRIDSADRFGAGR